MPESPAKKASEYETFKSVCSKYRTDPSSLEKINIYGIVTYNQLQPKKASADSCTKITIVDDTCDYGEKLKCNVFESSNSLNKIYDSCELGDIVRFHRFKIQLFNNVLQGVCQAKVSSWVRFKLNSNSYDFVGNKNSSIDEDDKIIVKRLRDWIKTNPLNQGLEEARLIRAVPSMADNDNPTDQQLEMASNLMNMQTNTVPAQLSPVLNKNDLVRTKLIYSRPLTISTIPLEGYCDLIVQVCAVCQSKGIKFLLVWDGTKSNYAIHQENEFTIESTLSSATAAAVNSDYQAKVFFSKEILEYLYQLYVFDEFVDDLESIEPGDYVLLKNIRSCKPINSAADMVIKLPGAHSTQNKYGRCLLKITSSNPDFSFITKLNKIDNAEHVAMALENVQNLIKNIEKKGKELNATFYNEDDFIAEFMNSNKLFDNTFDELVLKQKASNKPANQEIQPAAKKQEKTNIPNQKEQNENAVIRKENLFDRVNNLLEDQTCEYSMTDDESSTSGSQRQSLAITQTNITPPNNKQTSDSADSTVSKKPSPTTPTSNKKPSTQSTPQSTIKQFFSKAFGLITSRPIVTSTIESQQNTSPYKDKTSEKEQNENANCLMDTDDRNEDSYIPNSKRIKRVDSNEISSDIYKLKRLTSLTYIVPFLTSTSLNEINPQKTKHIPFYLSLEDLAEDASKTNYMKCRVNAKLFSYSISSCPQIASVFVHCKKCNYVNFTPFHLASIHQQATLSNCIADLQKNSSSNEEMEFDDEEVRRQNATNFNLNWLKTALPAEYISSSQATQFTQAQAPTQVNTNGDAPVMLYDCPRCLLYECEENENDARNTQASSTQLPAFTLDYIYRFWFKIRDHSFTLDPCLLEGELAQRFLNPVSAVKFYTHLAKSHEVYKMFHKKFDKKYVFTFETFNLSQKTADAAAAANLTGLSENSNSSLIPTKKNVNVLYKIVDMEEIVQI